MKPPIFATLAGCCGILLAAAGTLQAVPAPKKDPSAKNDTTFKASQDDTVRLQIFLDEQNFAPGKIDGAYGGFTKKSWLLYQEAQGMKPSEAFDAKTFTSVDPTYTTYTVAKDDLSALGTVPKEIPEQAKKQGAAVHLHAGNSSANATTSGWTFCGRSTRPGTSTRSRKATR